MLLLLLLSSVSFSDEPPASGMTTDAIISELLKNLSERERLLDEREQALNERREGLKQRESDLDERRESLSERENWLSERRASLVEIENSLNATANSLESYDAAVRTEIRFWKITTGVATAGAITVLVLGILR